MNLPFISGFASSPWRKWWGSPRLFGTPTAVESTDRSETAAAIPTNFQLLALEPRILMNAAPHDGGEALGESPWHALDPAELSSSPAPNRLLLIDENLDYAAELLAEWQAAWGDSTDYLWLSSDSTLSEIEAWLAEYSAIDELHILTHGSDGQFSLGTEWITADSVTTEQAFWNSLAERLSDHAEIFIYGCDVAATDFGQEFVVQLSEMLGVEVLASVDLTGAERLGGDWALEFSSRGGETFVAERVEPQFEWLGLLNAQSVSIDTDVPQETSARDRGSTRAVTINPDGSFVVVWTGEDSSGQGVFAQRFGENGIALGSEFRVNNTTSNNQRWAAVDSDNNGNFVVTWTSRGAGASGDDVFARRFNASGAAVGNEFRVNSSTAGHQLNSVVSVNDDGSFVIVWEGAGTGDSSGIYAQRYNAAGAAQGSAILVNEVTTGSQSDPAVSSNANGDFAVAWDDAAGFHAQRFLANGSRLGNQITVSSSATAGNGSILLNDNGSFVGTWRDTDGLLVESFVKVFNSDGQAVSGNISLAGLSLFNHTNPSIDGDGAGDFIVTWEGGSLADTAGVFARQFNADGSYASSSYLVNTPATGNQFKSSVAALSRDHNVVVWSGASPQDSAGIYVRLYERPNTIPVPQADNLGVLRSQVPATIAIADLLANDVDAEGDPLQIVQISRPQSGQLSNNGNGSITFNPASATGGPNSFSYSLTDATVRLGNYWDLDNSAWDLVGGQTGTVLGTTAGPQGRGLRFNETQQDRVVIGDVDYGANFTLDFEFFVDNFTGTGYRYLYSHGAVDNGIQIFIREDNAPTTSPRTLATVVRDANDSLDFHELNISLTGLAGGWHRYTLVVQDDVGAKVYLNGVLQKSTTKGADGVNPTGSIFLGSRSDLSSTRFHSGGIGDVALFRQAFRDSEVAAIPAMFNHDGQVQFAVNQAPTAVNDTASTPENSPLVGSVATNDSDSEGHARTYTVISGPSRGAFNLATDGTFEFRPLDAFRNLAAGQTASETIVYRVTDSVGDSSQATLTLTIEGRNNPPELGVNYQNPTFSLAEDGVLNGTGLLANLRDAEGQTLTVNVTPVTGPAHGTIQLNSNGTFVYRPQANYFGPDSFRYRVQDTQGGFLEITAQLQVNPINDAPQFNPPVTILHPEGTTLVGNLTAIDVEGETLTYRFVNGSGPNDNSLFLLNTSTGRLEFRNAPSFESPQDQNRDGIYVVRVEVSDSSGGTTEQVFTIEIEDGVAPPIFGPAETFTQPENTRPTWTFAPASDPDGDVLTYTLANTPDGNLFEIDSAQRTVRFRSQPNFENPADQNRDNVYSLTVVATDPTGRSAQKNISIVVTDVNETPRILQTAYSIPENTGNWQVLASDPENGSLTYQFSGLHADENLFSINTATGAIVFLSSPNFENPHDSDSDNQYRVGVTISDGAFTVTDTLTVQVTNVLEPGILRNDQVVVAEGGRLTSPTGGVLINDTLYDSGTPRVSVVTLPIHGTLTLLADGSFVYLHNGSETLTDSFVYRVQEASGHSGTATVNIQVLPVDDAPVAYPDAITLNSDSQVLIFPERLLRNDRDVDSPLQSVQLISQPSFGILIVKPDGSLLFDPQGNVGVTSFQYQAVSNGLVSNPTTVSLTIAAPTNTATANGTDAQRNNVPVDPGTIPLAPVTPVRATPTSTSTPTTEILQSLQSTQWNSAADTWNSEEDMNVDGWDQGYLVEGEWDAEAKVTRINVSAMPDVTTNQMGSKSLVNMWAEQQNWLKTYYQNIDEKKDELLIRLDFYTPVTATAAAGLLTVGYLTWMIRGGVLLTTFVSSLPAWQSFDPLPVVQNLVREKDNDEGIEDLVDNEL